MKCCFRLLGDIQMVFFIIQFKLKSEFKHLYLDILFMQLLVVFYLTGNTYLATWG